MRRPPAGLADAAGPGLAKPPYRPDIDGLRAVAVMAVVLFHYGVPRVSGGFVGVDVFFVISGYLIASVVAADIRRDRFSLLGFYERRLRRVAPALLAMLAVTAAACTVTILPGDLRFVGTSVIHAALFTSNFFFLSLADDYFAAESVAQQPVLHTWSLAVEAQFYLLFPLLPLLARRAAVPLVGIVAVLAALSFAASLWGVTHRPAAAFYLLPARGWELLLGAGIALGAFARLPPLAAEAAGVAGLVLIAAAVFAFDRATPFPGAAALLPCVGASLVIASGTGGPGSGGRATVAARALSLPPLVFVGRISYSLYLWHWPPLVLAGYGRAAGLGAGSRSVLLAATFAVAVLSWRFVERPFIARQRLPKPRNFALGALGGALAIAGAGLALHLTGVGLLRLARLPAAVLTLANGQFDRLEGECGPVEAAAAETASAAGMPCRFGAPGAAPSVAVWGNSYARMWVPALDAEAARAGVAGLSFVRSKCPPLLGVEAPEVGDCSRFNAAALDALRSRPGIRTVVLGANWFEFNGDLAAGLDRTLDGLKRLGARVFIVLAPPQAAYAVPRTLALAALRGEPPPPPIDAAGSRAAQKASVDAIEALRRRFRFTVIDPADLLCEGDACAVERDGRPLFYDAGHVTRFGALRNAALFEPVFRPE